MGSPFPGPTPPYSNPPIHPEYYKPSRFAISGISLGVTTTITTILNMNYVIGQEVRVLIPFGYGTRELDELTGIVIGIPASNQVTLNIFSLNFTPFVNPSFPQVPQIVAVGDVNTGAINSQGRINQLTFISGSFLDISPA